MRHVDERDEKIMLGLGLNKGIEKSLIDVDYSELVRAGLLVDENERISLTPQGMLVSNYVINYLT